MKNTSLKYFKHTWKNASRSVVILATGVVFTIFNEDGKLGFSTES